MGLFEVFGQIIKQVADKNKADETVETAEPIVFEEVKRKVEEVEQDSNTRTRGDMYKDYFKKLEEAKRENEANPEVKTADATVFDDLLKELERLQNASPESEQGEGQIPDVIATPEPQPTRTYGAQAFTNSGGSLQLRSEPQMMASKLNVYVPDTTVLNILQYSENKIILDGKPSRFVLVEYQGQQGWILESYLNFN